MSEREKIALAIEFFYEEIIEKYKELEKQVANESKLSAIFKKIDYKARISRFKDLKKKVTNMNVKTIAIEKEDDISADLKEKLNKCVNLFGNMIDAQVAMNMILNKKSDGKKMEIAEYKKTVDALKKANQSMQEGLKELDIIYADKADKE